MLIWSHGPDAFDHKTDRKPHSLPLPAQPGGADLARFRLNRIGRIAQLPDTPAVRGMINSVRHIVEVIRWEPDIAWFAAQMRAAYKDKIVGRIARGGVLWDRFEQAVDTFLTDPLASDRPLTECANEIAVAAVLAEDKSLAGCRIEYEPDLLPDGRRMRVHRR